MESINSVVEREKQEALSLLSKAFEEAKRIIEEKEREAIEEGEKIIKEAKERSERERAVRSSQKELEMKRIYSVKEDELMEKLISEAYAEFLQSEQYEQVLKRLMQESAKGGGAKVYSGKLDAQKVERIAKDLGLTYSGLAEFNRGFSVSLGEELIVYDFDRMLEDAKRELKRSIRLKVSEVGGKGKNN